MYFKNLFGIYFDFVNILGIFFNLFNKDFLLRNQVLCVKDEDYF